jgi:hypothetical protein
MGQLIGQKEYKSWKEGKRLTFKGAILGHCYECNGETESNSDCLGFKTCVLYQHSPWGRKAKKN